MRFCLLSSDVSPLCPMSITSESCSLFVSSFSYCWWREYWEGLPIGIGFSSGIDPWLFLVVRDTNHKKKFLLLPVKASMFLQLQSPPALCLQSVLCMIVHLAIQRRRKIQEECLWSSRVSSDNSFLQWKIAWECLILKWCAGCGVKLRFMD